VHRFAQIRMDLHSEKKLCKTVHITEPIWSADLARIFGLSKNELPVIAQFSETMKYKNQHIPKTELIWGVDVARIFGLSRSEFYRRLRSGEIRGIRAVRFLKGNMFSIYDAFKVAYPRADKKTIEEFVFKFRQEKVTSRFAEQRGRNKSRSRRGKNT